ncbi:MAG: helix-turn-helix domain-containing protein [Flavobacterium sp.]|nr:helix-turn-helix domain-containing protein [Flavobacterium sp.]
MVFYPLWISITIILYWLSYVGLFQSTVFQERKEIRRINEAKESKSFNNVRTSNILEEFRLCIENNYYDSNLSLEFVSNKIGISTNYLSQIINTNNIKFNDYVNKLRIEKAKEMILSTEFESYTITSIGLEAGFNSNASFYRAFKKEVGKSPSEFKKIHLIFYKFNNLVHLKFLKAINL